ncbi:MAG: ABC transporter ATP-binding protein [Rhodospirillaceae bacterium]|jgi:branched-chain amino acid transport system ATP-binding protein|nr:ABC transporter ATP-binding protein [Rhodospirillaceae bacterium]MBT4772169.1 ABC transporter ATP-binding protein [Rhodospirillaceae bacterium]MBT5359456.1 ABC transporter ATP-binding protein [Rhodospirillaceae bacterium]MBT5768351.1 ABC transporter ATP-binding protein [Rhodospirillaceae bacterium]MBT6309618.1 ABC transporter ATP-binding protein [Rhodospirillaceae bacterium]
MIAPALRLTGIEAFYGTAQALFGVDLEVPAGAVTVLLGRNGAGKSTTLKAAMGLVDVRAGRVFVGTRDVTGAPAYKVARTGLGYVPETRRVFGGLSVEENLVVGERVGVAGTVAWTRERLFDLFPPLAGMRERLAGQLSGGEQQMLTIARTLMGNPQIILLDEPSEGLAPVIVQQIAATIRTLAAEGLTVLLSEQNVRFAMHVASRAAVIERGRILVEGPIADIAADEGVREAYLTP